MALIEQAVFTSAETERSAGYQVVATSPGVSEADLVEVRKDGRWAYYRVARGEARKTVRPVLKWLEDMLGGNETVVKDSHKLADILEKAGCPRKSITKEC